MIGDAVTEERIAQVAFDTPPKDVSIGEMSEITLRPPGVKQALAVPGAALRLHGGKTGVWLLADGKPGFVPVTTGTQGADGRVQIIDGLKEGDVVIVHSESELAADSRIKVVSTLTGS
jgi:HlyD family secretion protein